MKKTMLKLILPVVTIIFSIMVQACNQSGNNQGQLEAEQHEESHDHEDTASGKLTLNDGSKWQADDPTNKNAESLISIGRQFSNKSNITLEDYHAFGKDIHSGINKMIQECTMEGEADEALHYWFLPLLEQSGTLQKATDTGGLSSITSEMINRLEIYSDYFE